MVENQNKEKSEAGKNWIKSLKCFPVEKRQGFPFLIPGYISYTSHTTPTIITSNQLIESIE